MILQNILPATEIWSLVCGSILGHFATLKTAESPSVLWNCDLLVVTAFSSILLNENVW